MTPSILERHEQEQRAKHERNLPLLDLKLAARARIPGVRVGDYIRLPRWHHQQPEFTRITHDWGDHVQTGDGSYFLSHGGHLSHSGGLDPGLAKDALVETSELKEGRVWFFDEDCSGGGRGVYFTAKMKVFVVKPGTDITGVYSLHPPFNLYVIEPTHQLRRGCKRMVIDKRWTLGYGHEAEFDTEAELAAWLAAHHLARDSHKALEEPGYHGLRWLPETLYAVVTVFLKIKKEPEPRFDLAPMNHAGACNWMDSCRNKYTDYRLIEWPAHQPHPKPPIYADGYRRDQDKPKAS